MKDEYKVEFLPVLVSTFDKLITAGGIERGNTILISGGCGSGKTIFCIQSLYNAALKGEKCVFLSMEESPEKIKRHMKTNFGWGLDELERKGTMVIQKLDPMALAKDIEVTLEEGDLRDRPSIDTILEKYPEISLIDTRRIDLPFHPDRIAIDSLSALSTAFADKNKYRLCIQILVESLTSHNSLNILTCETEQEPLKYSSIGPEEFLVDGVVVLYNIRKGQLRRRALEIVKLRCSEHVKELVPYTITKSGIRLMPEDKIF